MYRSFFKRMVDVFLAALLLVFFSWLILIIVILYLVAGERPVLFRQERVGRDERIFYMLKFRTLKVGTGPAKERQFWLGKVLRFLSLDELPQLWQVLKGDMSLVGPRPMPVHYLPLFSDAQRARHRVAPGITGLAQVSGRHSIPWQEKFALDVEYVRRQSFALDLQILVKTLFLLLSFQKDQSLDEEPLTRDSGDGR